MFVSLIAKICRMSVHMSVKIFLGMSGKNFLVTFVKKNINVKFACSGKLYCAPPQKDDAHTPMLTSFQTISSINYDKTYNKIINMCYLTTYQMRISFHVDR